MGWQDAPVVESSPAAPAWASAPEVAPTSATPPSTSLADIGRNFLSAAMRPVINAVGGIPEMAANAGVGLRNLSERGVNKLMPQFADAIYAANQHLAGDSQILAALLPQGRGPEGNQYQSFSSFYRPGIDATFAPPQTLPGKAAEFASTALVGGAMPAPQAAAQAPAGFVRAVTTPRDAALGASQQAGYVVPPATTNPTVTNKLLESLGGKIATEQDARLANQVVTDSLARKAVGLAEDTPISNEALSAVRAGAAQAYKTLRQVGDMQLDKEATQGLEEIAAKYTSSDLAKAIGGGNDIPKIVDAVKSEPLTGSKVVDAIALLRDKASAAYGSGDKALGGAYKAVSKQLEDLMERNLSGDALSAFRSARELIAKTYTVEKALNPSTGSVSAATLARELGKGKPLSDELLTAARFGQAFPKAAAPVLDSGSVRNTDVALGAIAAVADKHPQWLIYPFARMGVRAGLLSSAGQKLAVPASGAGVPPGLLMGSQAATEDLLGQQ